MTYYWHSNDKQSDETDQLRMTVVVRRSSLERRRDRRLFPLQRLRLTSLIVLLLRLETKQLLVLSEMVSL